MRSKTIGRIIASMILFVGTSATVVWQNSRVGIIWDAAYILENAWRMSLGQLPYRDFPFPYAPLTYVVQAILIRVSGRAFWHHIAYAALAAGTASVLTFALVEALLIRKKVSSPGVVAFVLTLPLILLGIYCIIPHPFYDADCCLAILLSLWLLLRLDVSRSTAIAAGISIVVPSFIKQNIGLFHGAAATGILMFAWIVCRKDSSSRVGTVLCASFATGAVALIAIEALVGLRDYYHWTIEFAAQRRLPPFAEQLEMFRDPRPWIGAGLALVGVASRRLGARLENRYVSGAALVLFVAPFLWIWYSWWANGSLVDGAYYLIGLWPFMILVALIFAVVQIKADPDLSVIAILILASIAGSFLSHGAEGSSYGIWPFLIVLIAATLPTSREARFPIPELIASCVIVASIAVPAWFYVAGEQRLHYIDRRGLLKHSSAPALQGFNAAGDYLPDFDELRAFVAARIPSQDAILCIPGEDLFYYATGRTPRFPVLLFDNTVNPYRTEEIASLALRRNVRWLIIKKRLQIRGTPMTQEQATITLLEPHFRIVGDLRNYQVWKRI